MASLTEIYNWKLKVFKCQVNIFFLILLNAELYVPAYAKQK